MPGWLPVSAEYLAVASFPSSQFTSRPDFWFYMGTRIQMEVLTIARGVPMESSAQPQIFLKSIITSGKHSLCPWLFKCLIHLHGVYQSYPATTNYPSSR